MAAAAMAMLVLLYKNMLVLLCFFWAALCNSFESNSAKISKLREDSVGVCF